MGVAVVLRLAPAFALLPFLVLSSLGRRFGSTAARVVVTEQRDLEVGGAKVARGALRDVWLDDDPLEPRVVVTHGDDLQLLALWFENREQARRFARALGEGDTLVAGVRPRRSDLLPSLRFVAVTLVLVAAHAYYGVAVLLFFALELRGLLVARQLVVRADELELRSAFDREVFALDSVRAVDVDEGVITLGGERELRFGSPSARDLHFAAPAWTDRLRRRALAGLLERRRHERREPATEG